MIYTGGRTREKQTRISNMEKKKSRETRANDEDAKSGKGGGRERGRERGRELGIRVTSPRLISIIE